MWRFSRHKWPKIYLSLWVISCDLGINGEKPPKQFATTEAWYRELPKVEIGLNNLFIKSQEDFGKLLTGDEEDMARLEANNPYLKLAGEFFDAWSEAEQLRFQKREIKEQ